MPTYDYKCQKCGVSLEVTRSITDTSIQKHKQCGGKLIHVISKPTIVYKGSGWARKATS